MDAQALLEAVTAALPGARLRDKTNLPAVEVPLDKLEEAARRLRTDAVFSFDMLLAHTAVDWPAENKQEAGQGAAAPCFELVYILFSTTHGHQLMLLSRVDRGAPVVPSVSGIWAVAEFLEREVYDLLGVQYDNHLDLRRVFLEDDWQGFPLRKDYVDEHMLERPS